MTRAATWSRPRPETSPVSTPPPASLVDRVLRVVALAFFVAALAYAAPTALLRSLRWSLQAASVIGEDTQAQRRRALGAPWVAAIEEIRRAVPAGGTYSLVDGGVERGANAYWVRFDLAPRRAHYLGQWWDLPAAARVPLRDPWVVVAFHPPRPPALLSRQQFRALLERRDARR